MTNCVLDDIGMGDDKVPNRTVCAVLDEMRKCRETNNYSYLSGLIEEVQTLANRMEAALWDQTDIKYKRDELKKLKVEIEELKEERDLLVKGVKDLETAIEKN